MMTFLKLDFLLNIQKSNYIKSKKIYIELLCIIQKYICLKCNHRFLYWLLGDAFLKEKTKFICIPSLVLNL